MQLGRDLFNGNIRAMMVNVPQLGEAKLYGYRYDQLNRIKAMNSFNGFDSTLNKFGASNVPTISTDYKERITYDPNGNIRSYLRNGTTQGGTPLGMDSLTYGYNTDTYGHLLNNKLRQVHDAVGDGNYAEDIDKQGADNYKFDAIGNLVQDKAEGIYDPAFPPKNMIGWTVYGKIAWIRKIKAGVTTDITYSYDPSGNRISKAVTIGSTTTTTYYVRDASGNTMSVYAKDAAINSGALTQTEVSEYGSSRLGVWNINRSVAAIGSTDFSVFRNNFIRGNKSFELSNHLGNVLATVSDKKIQHNTSGTAVDWYNAEVVTAQDYFVFGMGMPGRGYSLGGSPYRYSINGQEKSNELNPNLTTAQFWEYDSRIGRRWNVDPVFRSSISPYVTFANNPIWVKDLLGNDTLKINGANNSFIYFVHKDIVKTTFSVSVDLRTQKIINVPGAPDAFGYSIEGSVNVSNGVGAGSLKGSVSSFLVMTRGAYAWQPFKYGYAGGSAGASTTIGENATAALTFSPFIGYFSKKPLNGDKADEQKMTPQSWEGDFANLSASIQGDVDFGGAIGATYFKSSPYDNQKGSWWGISIDASVSTGEGTSVGIQGGGTIYALQERYPVITNDLSTTRSLLKWQEFMTGGIFPGTTMSDGIVDMEKAIQKISDGFDNIGKEWDGIIWNLDYLKDHIY